MAPVGMTQLTLSPWVLVGPGHDGFAEVEGYSPHPRERGGHPTAPLLWETLQVLVASPGLSQ